MLFLFPEEEVQSFLDRNTLIPLDMISSHGHEGGGIVERPSRTLTRAPWECPQFVLRCPRVEPVVG